MDYEGEGLTKGMVEQGAARSLHCKPVRGPSRPILMSSDWFLEKEEIFVLFKLLLTLFFCYL